MQQPVQQPESPDPSPQASGPVPPTGTRHAPGTALRLLPPRTHHSAVPVLSSDQLAVLDVPPGSGPVLVAGAPGTGKSTVLVEAAVRRTQRDGLDPERMLILAPGRLAADTLRDRFTARLDRSLSTTPARTWASYAFDLIRRANSTRSSAVRPDSMIRSKSWRTSCRNPLVCRAAPRSSGQGSSSPGNACPSRSSLMIRSCSGPESSFGGRGSGRMPSALARRITSKA